MNGIVFDIQECSLHDGPGMRIAIFLKGCPLRCSWCHSPEGQSPDIQTLHFPDLPPRLCGRVWSANELACYINERSELLPQRAVTFSGGEPLMQNRFLLEVMELVAPGTHILIESSGHCDRTAFLAAVKKASYVYFGVKLLNEQESLSLTGKSCRTALENLMLLDQNCSTPYAFRIPFLHGITDRKEYLLELAGLCSQLKRLEKIYFLPSNKNAGAKYASCGRVFSSCYDVNYRCTLPDDITFPVPVETL